MKRIITMTLALFSFCAGAQEFKLDNVKYQTISWTAFFKRLESNPKLVYYDVRSEGERSDNGALVQHNQGKIKGAIETDVDAFKKYYPQYLKHKNDTIYLYCSHSRRSRQVAQQLADSGFVKVVNINAGISYFNTLSEKEMPYRSKYYTSNLKYRLISPADLELKLNDKNVQLIDIRPDSMYQYNTIYGLVKGVKHIANKNCIDSIALFDKTKEIVLIDNNGDLSPIVAKQLLKRGCKRVSVLFYGLEQLIHTVPSFQRSYLQLQYPTILPSELIELKKNEDITIIDIRTENEFKNMDTVEWKNVGHLKDAVNIPFSELSEKALFPYKSKKVVIYNNTRFPDELYNAAKILKQYGINDVRLLPGGVHKIKWLVANTDKKHFDTLLSNK